MRRNCTHSASVGQTRRGVSLIELIITITLGGLVLTMGIGTLHLLLRTDKTLADSLWRSQTVSQLSQTFRGDVHAARSVELEQPENAPNANEPARPALRLELAPDHRVRYSIEDHAVLRSETKAEKAVQTERFRFSPGTEISFAVNESAPVALVIRSANPQAMKPNHPQHPVPLRELKIAAGAGRDYRFAESETRNQRPGRQGK